MRCAISFKCVEFSNPFPTVSCPTIALVSQSDLNVKYVLRYVLCLLSSRYCTDVSFHKPLGVNFLATRCFRKRGRNTIPLQNISFIKLHSASLVALQNLYALILINQNNTNNQNNAGKYI